MFEGPDEKLSRLEKRFEHQWDLLFPEITWQRQVKPIPAQLLPGNKKKSTFVYDYQCGKVLLEVQGAVFGQVKKIGGTPYIRMMGHNSPKGITRDHIKANLATLNGFTPVYLSEKLMTETHLHWIARIIETRG